MPDDFLFLPSVRRVAWWNSYGRALDPVQNWTDKWTAVLEGLGGSAANKDWKAIEQEALDLAMDAFGQTRAGRISLYDTRKAFYRFLCLALVLGGEDQLGALFERCLGADVYVPLKYTDGSNKLFHCGFNTYAFNEVGGNHPDALVYRIDSIIKDSGKVYNGASIGGSGEIITWTKALPVVADFSALTLRVFVDMAADGMTRTIFRSGSPTVDNGAFMLQKFATNKYKFLIHDGTSFKTIDSNAVVSGNPEEVRVVVNGTSVKMYVDGVEQTDTVTLTNPPAYHDSGDLKVGFTGTLFKGNLYEISLDAEVITP